MSEKSELIRRLTNQKSEVFIKKKKSEEITQESRKIGFTKNNSKLLQKKKTRLSRESSEDVINDFPIYFTKSEQVIEQINQVEEDILALIQVIEKNEQEIKETQKNAEINEKCLDKKIKQLENDKNNFKIAVKLAEDSLAQIQNKNNWFEIQPKSTNFAETEKILKAIDQMVKPKSEKNSIIEFRTEIGSKTNLIRYLTDTEKFVYKIYSELLNKNVHLIAKQVN